MNEELYHYGIKGMKWGIRRTPEQLGHVITKSQSSGEKKTAKTSEKKMPGRSGQKTSSISNDELQRRINRLNMEERYEDLVARQKARSNTGVKATAKKLLGNAAEDFGRQLLSKAVSKLVDRIAGDKKFDIKDFRDMDINDMDADTISKVAKWYGDAMKIDTTRSKLHPSSESSSSTDYAKRPARGYTNSSSSNQKQLDEWIKQRNRAMRDLNR